VPSVTAANAGAPAAGRAASSTAAQSGGGGGGGYRLPPQEILDIVDMPPQPGLSFSPDRTLV
jgi:hypothetical protein